MLDGMWKHGDMLTHAVSTKPVSDKLVVTISGDTTKDHFMANGWPDQGTNNTNLLYVIGSNGGYLKPGWFGEIAGPAASRGFDPITGALGAATGAAAYASAASAIAFAVSGGDDRVVQNFGRSDYSGLVNTTII
jgi:hypothetical protein